ncbi:hypothetical protein TREMEDRAFT_40668 [Tremella mesenterica DSM 1558]|uniref:uncharacterized protein n=1 Tax=Tremella mesenterica (strain ATCC 24925 / CBS 8224 / DSM 1558 / NBRC 9311 / NRRL Y-6157 / RJB 2259-6 / UBC 559-6) TaxID=578456 RepID=UPI0003F4A36F|nr:uncharacterized protein TREMEDRAFT_40668 [Tremella mesenterica DSM 1558]EIW67086.1 hypothetical protein TREMEDRAFT_40668 [Tremella mesenterica DSM 1558]
MAPVSPTAAEEYELPELDYDHDDLHPPEDEEHARLLQTQKPPPEEGKPVIEDSDERPLLGELDQEVIGKGTKVEQLIATTVPTTDDTSLPTLTPRVVILGSAFCALGASASQVFYFKSNAPSFSAYFVILVTYPLGHLLANERLVKRGKRWMGLDLNPGKFSIKEALLVSVIFSSGSSSAYAADILAIMDLYYKTPLPALPSIALLLTTQCVGFGLAGMVHSLLVSPPAMYWPANLVTVQLFTTLYSSSSTALSASAKLLTVRRLRIFLLIFAMTWAYQFLPSLLFPTLTSVAVLCLLDNKSWWLRVLGSGYDGFGMLDFSFDWSSVGMSGPLFTPLWALTNFFGGMIGMIWIVTPLMLLFNFWDAREFPSPVSAGLFNSTFQKFDVTSVLNSDLSLDIQKWEEAKPLLLTPHFALTYALSFASLSSVLVHVWLWHWDEIKLGNFLLSLQCILMRSYRPVPQSWYMGLLAVNFGIAVILVKTTPLQMPIWAVILSIAIAAVSYHLNSPCSVGVIAAVSNTRIGLVSYHFKDMAMSQALDLVQDLKLGWYMSIPPREMFACQILGTVLGALCNYITLVSVLSSKRPYLDGTLVDPTGQWTGRSPAIFYSASVIWGAVSPARFFTGKYVVLYGGFVVGGMIPVICWLAHKRWPGKKFNKVVFPIICSGATLVPQVPSNTMLTGIIVAIVAHKWWAVKYPELYNRYIYVLSSALDAGTSICALCVYLLFGVMTQWSGPVWWGNPKKDSEHCLSGS